MSQPDELNPPPPAVSAGPDIQSQHGDTVSEPPLTAKEELTDFFKTAMIAVLLALLIRAFLFEPFNIPSGSMKPTLLVGDYLFVSKPAYGYSRYSFPFGLAPLDGRVWDKQPKRGDVIVFKLPSNPRIDYIKRLIAFPGETVQMRNGRLYINGERVPREAIGIEEGTGPEDVGTPMYHYIETLPGGVVHDIFEESDSEILDNTPVYVVPEGHYFMMGDNRDNSQDSRVPGAVGFVPFENFVGRADFLFFSTNGSAGLFEFWKWPWTLRYDRFFNGLAPVRLQPESGAKNGE